jgi:hypothetical protein
LQYRVVLLEVHGEDPLAMLALDHLDRLLRGDATRLAALRVRGIDLPVGSLSVLLLLLGVIYGACMGVFAQTSAGSGDWRQMAASAAKVPMLFFLTLAVTLPSLYVFNALVGSRLRFGALVRLMVGAMAVTLSVLASVGPIVAFFSLSTSSYGFMVLLNVVVFALSGLLGLAFLLQTLARLSVLQDEGDAGLTRDLAVPTVPQAEAGADPASGEGWRDDATASAAPPRPAVDDATDATEQPEGALDRLDGQVLGPHVKVVFRVWLIVFGLVGAQMGWLLRPFIGSPGKAFTFLRPRGGNFFESVWQHLVSLVGG